VPFKVSLHGRLQTQALSRFLFFSFLFLLLINASHTQLGIRFVSGFKPDFESPNPFSLIHYMGVVPIINELISESSLTDAMAKAIQHTMEREIAASSSSSDPVTPRSPSGRQLHSATERQERIRLRMLKQIGGLLGTVIIIIMLYYTFYYSLFLIYLICRAHIRDRQLASRRESVAYRQLPAQAGQAGQGPAPRTFGPRLYWQLHAPAYRGGGAGQ
jgi:hypothetical protein